ncbi:hypothetical protein WBP06_20655 [Novosphingobium sp. BL-8H]|uniref:hypothetical protein n=1 Tax=Novosphingobium sp. BL-8H TaxID=3127640 RepID=UPI00375778E2
MLDRREALRRQCETINAIAEAVGLASIEPGVRAHLTDLIARARIVASPHAPGKLRWLSIASTRQLYRDIQFLLEPPVLSWSLLTQIARADLALSALSAKPKR